MKPPIVLLIKNASEEAKKINIFGENDKYVFIESDVQGISYDVICERISKTPKKIGDLFVIGRSYNTIDDHFPDNNTAFVFKHKDDNGGMVQNIYNMVVDPYQQLPDRANVAMDVEALDKNTEISLTLKAWTKVVVHLCDAKPFDESSNPVPNENKQALDELVNLTKPETSEGNPIEETLKDMGANKETVSATPTQEANPDNKPETTEIPASDTNTGTVTENTETPNVTVVTPETLQTPTTEPTPPSDGTKPVPMDEQPPVSTEPTIPSVADNTPATPDTKSTL